MRERNGDEHGIQMFPNKATTVHTVVAVNKMRWSVSVTESSACKIKACRGFLNKKIYYDDKGRRRRHRCHLDWSCNHCVLEDVDVRGTLHAAVVVVVVVVVDGVVARRMMTADVVVVVVAAVVVAVVASPETDALGIAAAANLGNVQHYHYHCHHRHVWGENREKKTQRLGPGVTCPYQVLNSLRSERVGVRIPATAYHFFFNIWGKGGGGWKGCLKGEGVSVRCGPLSTSTDSPTFQVERALSRRLSF